MNREERDTFYNWHVAINRATEDLGYDKSRFMYDAKDIAEEWDRLPYWFGLERTGKLPVVHRQCSHSGEQEIVDNHLTCCLGVETRKCEFLAMLDKAEGVSGEDMDKIKARTCIAHAMTVKANNNGHLDTSEGIIMHEGDRMFWDNVYRNMAAKDEG